jgi:type IV secretory pathway TraG/TraD family ATPase VirD4
MLSDVGELLKANPNGIDIFEAIRAKKIVYVLLDSRTYGESSRALGKLILQDLKAASARVDAEIPRDARVPFTVVVDEFSDLATEEFLGFLDRARSSKIGVVVAHQEIADLSRISPEFSHRLMNSTSTLFAFLQKVPETSDLIASIGGTKTTKKVTEQAKDNWLFGDEKTGMKSIREVEEFIIHPNTVRSLAVGECVMVQKYPRSMSMIIKVKPESTNYLRDEEVRRILEGRRTAHVVRAFPTTRRTAPQVAHLAATERSELRANEAKF